MTPAQRHPRRVAALAAAALAAIAATFALAVPASTDAAGTTLQPPKITILHAASTPDSSYIFVAPKTTGGTGQEGPEIVDQQGRPVWFDNAGVQATDFRVQHYNGEPVLTWWQGAATGGAGSGQGVDQIADSSYHVIATVSAGHGLAADQHEFNITPDGTALITVYNTIPYDLSSVGGPVNGHVTEGVVQEIDIATGQVIFEWHSLDHVPLSESHQPVPTNPATAYDYFHINSVQLDKDGNLLISSRHTWTIYEVDRHSGAILWRLGGKSSDFTLGPGVQTAWQHNAIQDGTDTIRIFDNESNGTKVQPQSRVIWVKLNLKKKTATLVRQVVHPAGLSAGSQGNSQRLPDGNLFVGWGALGRFSEFDSDGNLTFDGQVPAGYDDYRAYRFPWTGNPTDPPTATATAAGGSTTVDAVWNGATRVAGWLVLGGSSPGSLTPIGWAAWNGLDTTITVPGSPAYVQVAAENASGRVFARSSTVAAS